MTDQHNLDNANDRPDEQHRVEKRPDESSGLLIEAKLKIFNPESGEVIVEGRA